MHYCDKPQLKKNTLEIVIYTHGTPTKETEIDLSSIQKCEFFPPRLLKKILKDPTKYLGSKPGVEGLKQEEWWLVKIKQTAWDEFIIKHVKNVSKTKNKFLILH